MSEAKKRNAFHIEAGRHFESGRPEWHLLDDRDGEWGSFSNRAAATACLAGFRAIGFVPRPGEPSDDDPVVTHPEPTFTQRIQLRDRSDGKEHGPSVTITVAAGPDFPTTPDGFSSQLGYFVGDVLAGKPNQSVSIKSTLDPWPLPAAWKKP